MSKNKEEQRQCVIDEIVDTEGKYLSRLVLVKNEFIPPLKAILERDDFLMQVSIRVSVWVIDPVWPFLSLARGIL